MLIKPALYKIDVQFNKSLYWKSFALFLLFLVLVSSIAMNKDQYIASQLKVFIFGNQAFQFLPQYFWHNVTYLGDALILVPLLSFICLFSVKAWAAMFGSVPLAFFLSHAGKAFFAIPRPAAILEHDQFTIIGRTLAAHSSFPSGHTITIFTAMSALIFVYMKQNKHQSNLRNAVTAMLLFIAAITAISRVAVGAHWPADLLLGALLGGIAGLSGEYLSRHYSKWWNWTVTKPIYLGYFILGFCALLLYLMASGETPALFIVWVAIIVSGTVGTYVSLKTLLLK
ncbi:phosphatase PAP2 family protein [Paraglaciecola aquimarina]|uniref:undecaprenyl-diphosphate phosphatase n=1 Tax=Paraglaciecola algarum TaxID=3050085 RepID=A0ABS9D9U0_9ALTE|nr:phosphatase PAP2 family protein [Paraglaciecola sp. G1-23]MCF2949570.1 phosphatase PAP2 family protein [Paraglaciecola sp. G1-23]